MKFSLQSDTLAFQLNRPGVIKRDMGTVLVPTVAAQAKKFKDSEEDLGHFFLSASGAAEGVPEKDALKFYMLKHAVYMVRQQMHPLAPLGKYRRVLDLYHENLALIGARMFFYLLLICTRESRHCSSSTSAQTVAKWSNLYGPACWQFLQSIRGKTSEGAADYFLAAPPHVLLGSYTRFLADVFNEGNFTSSYGGPTWGKIAELLRDYVNGFKPADVMLDESFALQHNTCSIFNKGMYYDHFTPILERILDVQRSGQIPQYIADSNDQFCVDSVKGTFYELKGIIDGFGDPGYVDWFLVEELGGKGSYATQQKMQVNKHGYPSKFKAKVEIEKLKQQQQEAAKVAEESQMITIYPGFKLKKAPSTREKAA